MKNWVKRQLATFFNLERRNFINKVITKIIEDNGHKCTKTNEILETKKNYYKDLRTEKNSDQ